MQFDDNMVKEIIQFSDLQRSFRSFKKLSSEERSRIMQREVWKWRQGATKDLFPYV